MKKIRRFFGLYTVSELTDFGNFLLKSRRSFKGHEDLRWMVYHSDFCNWIDTENDDDE